MREITEEHKARMDSRHASPPASVLWLALQLAINGPEAARQAYLKLGADRRALVRIGYAIVFENEYQFELGYSHTRPSMFVGVNEGRAVDLNGPHFIYEVLLLRAVIQFVCSCLQ